MDAWRSALGSVVGSGMTFSNAFTMQRGLEPTAGATATVSGQRAVDLAGGVAVVPAISLLLKPEPMAMEPRPRPVGSLVPPSGLG